MTFEYTLFPAIMVPHTCTHDGDSRAQHKPVSSGKWQRKVAWGLRKVISQWVGSLSPPLPRLPPSLHTWVRARNEIYRYKNGMHTYITLHFITWNYITLHNLLLYEITLHYITLHIIINIWVHSISTAWNKATWLTY
jgi:hypothetical protein